MAGVTALLWCDNRVVTLLSTNAQPQQHSTVQRKEHDGSHSDIPCPVGMELYNRYMGGVDKNDQLRQYYHVRIKSRKFYRYIFWFLFEVSHTSCIPITLVLQRNPSKNSGYRWHGASLETTTVANVLAVQPSPLSSFHSVTIQ